MSKKCLFKSQITFKSIALFLIVFLLIILIWNLVFQPLVAWAYFPPICTSGVEIYNDNTYLEYQYGKEMQKFLNEAYDFEKQKVINFYYEDNKRRDNIFYGKVSDFYVLETEHSDNVNAFLKDSNYSLSDNTRDYYLYAKFDDEAKLVYCIAVEKSNKNIRYLLITDCSVKNLNSLLVRQTSLEW